MCKILVLHSYKVDESTKQKLLRVSCLDYYQISANDRESDHISETIKIFLVLGTY